MITTLNPSYLLYFNILVFMMKLMLLGVWHVIGTPNVAKVDRVSTNTSLNTEMIVSMLQ